MPRKQDGFSAAILMGRYLRDGIEKYRSEFPRAELIRVGKLNDPEKVAKTLRENFPQIFESKNKVIVAQYANFEGSRKLLLEHLNAVLQALENPPHKEGRGNGSSDGESTLQHASFARRR